MVMNIPASGNGILIIDGFERADLARNWSSTVGSPPIGARFTDVDSVSPSPTRSRTPLPLALVVGRY